MFNNTSGTLPINVEGSKRYLKLVKANRKITPRNRPFGFGNTRISTDYAQKSPRNDVALSPPLWHGACCSPGSLRFGPRTRSEEPYLPPSSSSLMTACVPHPYSNQKQCLSHHPRRPGSHAAHHHRGSGGSLQAQQAQPLELPRITELLPQELTLSLHSGRRLKLSMQGAQMCATCIYGFNNNNNNNVICSSFIVFWEVKEGHRGKANWGMWHDRSEEFGGWAMHSICHWSDQYGWHWIELKLCKNI